MTDPFVPDRPVICPYDSNHSIAQSRLQRHIIKCSKNFPPNYRLSCPYNETHRLPKAEIEKHIKDCPDKKYVDAIIYEGLSSRCSAMSFKMEDRSVIHCDESWDDAQDDDTFYDLSSICDLDVSSKSPLRVNDYEPGPEMSNRPHIVKPKAIRPPFGRPEALMIEVSDNSAVEEIESVKSFMGMGRGKRVGNLNDEKLEIIGRGRGAALKEA